MATIEKSDRTKTRRELEAERLAAHVKRLVDQAPPLGPGQRARLKGILDCSRKPVVKEVA